MPVQLPAIPSFCLFLLFRTPSSSDLVDGMPSGTVLCEFLVFHCVAWRQWRSLADHPTSSGFRITCLWTLLDTVRTCMTRALPSDSPPVRNLSHWFEWLDVVSSVILDSLWVFNAMPNRPPRLKYCSQRSLRKWDKLVYFSGGFLSENLSRVRYG